MKKGSVASLVVGLAVMAAACTATAQDNPGDGSPSTSVPLPGTQAFGLTEAEFTEYVEEVEGLIAECMAGAGFEYVPVDVTAVLEVGIWMRADPNMTREEYKSQWGYGISTREDNPPREIGLGQQNIQVYESLPESEKIAYDRTLFGDDTDATFALALDDEDFGAIGGCTEEAVTAVSPQEMMSSSFINPKDVLIEGDPRVIAAEEEWMDCMSEDGYEYEDQDEIIEEYEERFEALTDGEDPEDLSGEDLEALEELQAEEIAVALKDLECQGPLDEVIREVEIEIYGEPVSG
jgi:hypothetical protein